VKRAAIVASVLAMSAGCGAEPPTPTGPAARARVAPSSPSGAASSSTSGPPRATPPTLGGDRDLSCHVEADGRLLCWGDQFHAVPYPVVGVAHARAVVPWSEGVVVDTSGGYLFVTGSGKSSKELDAPPGALEIALGGGVTCARRADGSVLCRSPEGWAPLALGRRAIAITGGAWLVALLDDHTLRTFRCPDGGAPKAGCRPVPDELPLPSERVQRVDGSREGLCTVDSEGVARCVGTAFGERALLGCIEEARDVVAASAGGDHACALHRDGTVDCCGKNTHGELGEGTSRPLTGLVRVKGVEHAEEIFAQRGHTCVIEAGLARCWGEERASGRPRTRQEASLPIAARAVYAAGGVTCASGTPEKVTCFGGLTGDFTFPVEVRDLAIGSVGVCALLSDGTVACSNGREVSRPLPDVTDGDAISGGGDQYCVHRRAKTARCWGDDPHATLPHEIRATTSSVEQSFETGCHVAIGGAVTCWGTLADQAWPTADPKKPSPFVRVPRVTAVEIATSPRMACAREASGKVTCWGAGAPSGKPPFDIGVADAVSLAVGGENACVVRRSGSVACFGRSLGATGKIDEPAHDVAELRGARALAVGSTHACALLEGDVVRCWGFDDRGQLGAPKLPSKIVAPPP
jgi:hypothetical protein